MGTAESKGSVEAPTLVIPQTSGSEEVKEKPKCKACCACPETKRVRDACIVENGAENCTELIEAHRECMKKMGFNI